HTRSKRDWSSDVCSSDLMPYSLLEAKPIEELCKVVDCEHKTAPYVDESDYLVVRTSNVRDGQLVMESMKYTTLEGYNEWTSRAEIGRASCRERVERAGGE